jgi:hypothetical protein
LLVSYSSFFSPLALIASWIFMALLPFDCSHAGTNGLITRMYSLDRQGLVILSYFPSLAIGEIQGILEQISTLAVIGGYPGSVLFGYFVSSESPVYWPGIPFTLAALYSSLAAVIFYYFIFRHSDGVDEFPLSSVESSESDKELLTTAPSSSSSSPTPINWL